jgi:glycosyltransferase involved in cell wall biosynthesis
MDNIFETPLISLIIPTHCRGLYLSRLLESINIQKYRKKIEIIVISDVANEETDLVIISYLSSNDFYIRRNGIKGPAESRNIGIKLANGKYIMFLDDDDAWHANFSELIVDYLSSNNPNVAYSNCIVVKETRPNSGPKILGENLIDLKGKLDLNIYIKNQIHMSCYIFSSNILNNLQFDSTLKAYEDWDFLLSIIDRDMPIHIPITCSYVYEVDDETSDRRGAATPAKDFNAVLDYLSIYRKHPAPNILLKEERKLLLQSVGLDIPSNFL